MPRCPPSPLCRAETSCWPAGITSVLCWRVCSPPIRYHDHLMKRTIQTPRGPVILRTTTAADGLAVRELRLEALRTVSFAFGSSFEEESQFGDDEWIRRAARGDGTGTQAT